VSTRKISDQLGQTRGSMTQDRYLGRGIKDRRTGDVLEGIVPRTTSRPLPMNLMLVPSP